MMKLLIKYIKFDNNINLYFILNNMILIYYKFKSK